MVEDAERDGKLKAGMTIIEPTSGNTGQIKKFINFILILNKQMFGSLFQVSVWL